MKNEKKFFCKKLSAETLKELDDFLNTYPNEEVDYLVWREAIELYVKVLYELADSIKEYGEAFDKIFKDNNYENMLTDNTYKRDVVMFKINEELADLERRVIGPSPELWKKISELEKKYYKNI